MTPRSGFLGALLLGGMLVVSTTETVRGGGGPRPSERVEHFDGTGVSIFTILPDQSEWTIENFWTNNSVNGTVGFPDDTTTFINCLPTHRTVAETSLDCRIFDPVSGQWGDPLQTTVAREYLDGDFLNAYNSLLGVTGEYLAFVDAPGVSGTYRLLFTTAVENPAGFPFLLGATNPSTDFAFLARDVDLPSGATGTTNFTVGIQTGEHCLDFHVTPDRPGGSLVGTLDVREQTNGTCGDVIAEDRSTSLIPSGGVGAAGAGCLYLVTEVGLCEGFTLAPKDFVCLPCTGDCLEIDVPVSLLFESSTVSSGYGACTGVRVVLAEQGMCSPTCRGDGEFPGAVAFTTAPD